MYSQIVENSFGLMAAVELDLLMERRAELWALLAENKQLCLVL